MARRPEVFKAVVQRAVGRIMTSRKAHVHVHVLVPDGVWHISDDNVLFQNLPVPTRVDLAEICHDLSLSVQRFLVSNKLSRGEDDKPPPPDPQPRYLELALSAGERVAAAKVDRKTTDDDGKKTPRQRCGDDRGLPARPADRPPRRPAPAPLARDPTADTAEGPQSTRRSCGR